MARFSDVLISWLTIARTPEEMVDYYTQRVIANPDRFTNIKDEGGHDIGYYVNYIKRLAIPDENERTLMLNKAYSSVRYIINNLIFDISNNNLLPYIEFILYKCTDKNIPEDMENITEYLKAYDQLKRSPIPNFNKNIQSFNSFTELQNYLQPYMANIQNEKFRMNDQYLQQHQKTEAATTIYDDGKFKIIRIVSAEASADLCRDTGWCVKDPKYFEHYNIGSSNPLYLISKDGYKYGLIDFGSMQFKDPKDAPATEQMAQEIYPVLVKSGLAENLSLNGDFEVFVSIPEFNKNLVAKNISSLNNFKKYDDAYLQQKEHFSNEGKYTSNGVSEFKEQQKEFFSLRGKIKVGIHSSAKYLGPNDDLEKAIINYINNINSQHGYYFSDDLLNFYSSGVNEFYTNKLDIINGKFSHPDDYRDEGDTDDSLASEFKNIQELKSKFNNINMVNLEKILEAKKQTIVWKE